MAPKNMKVNKVEILYKILMLTAPKYSKGKLTKGKNLIQACEEVGITHQTFSSWRREDKAFEAMYENAKTAMIEMMRFQARSIVEDALFGHMKLKDKEKVDISLRFLEKTDKEFKDRQELEVKIDGNSFGTSKEELEERAKQLIKSLNYDSNYKLPTGEQSSSFPNITSEYDSNSETPEGEEGNGLE